MYLRSGETKGKVLNVVSPEPLGGQLLRQPDAILAPTLPDKKRAASGMLTAHGVLKVH